MEIQGYPNYLIYPDGRIWSNYRKGGFLKHAVHWKGYHQVDLRRDGKRKMFSVHRLVAIHYIPNPDNKPQVDHKNRIRDDNVWRFQKRINKKTYRKLFRTKIDAIVYKFCFLLLNQQRKRLACGVRR